MAKLKNRTITEISEDVLYGGKIPPHSRELEANVLGGMIINNDLIDIITTILKPEYFYVNANGLICRAIFDLKDRNETVDLITLTEELKSRAELDAVGGPYLLAELSTAFASQESIQFSAKKIKENWEKRQVILITYSGNEAAYDPTMTSPALINKIEQDLFDIGNSLHKKNATTTKEGVKSLLHEIESKTGNETLMGIPSGFNEVDAITAGFQDDNLIILAGRPSHGKTAFALACARNAAHEYQKNVGIFSIEMSQRELALRQLSSEAEIDSRKIKTGQMTDNDWKKLTDAYIAIEKAGQVVIDDSTPLSLMELRSKARRMKIEYDIHMIMVDYLQLMDMQGKKGSFSDRYIEIGQITTGLKQLSKELHMPVIALSQLSRKVEDRADKRPQMSDLRESGNIEQDADVIIFVNRPVVYMSKDNPEFHNIQYDAEIIIGKQRNGPTGLAKLKFKDTYSKFYNKSDFPDDSKYYSSSSEPF